MGWNPTARRDPVVRELECSRDEHGVAHATITITPWGARERLAYQDRSANAMRMVMVEGPDGTETQVRKVMPSELTLVHLALTVTACTGFAPGFSWANREDVETLGDPGILEEVSLLALEVQPLPTGKVRTPADRKVSTPSAPAGVSDAEAADFDEGNEPSDPSPTP